VKIVSVSPASAPASDAEPAADAKSIYGAAALINDRRLRNGSMVVEAPGTKQGYDSRILNYDPSLTIQFPYDMTAGKSLISTVSNTKLPVPSILTGMKEIPKTQQLALKSAAVLTCLSAPPPEDAFRPPYAGTSKPIYETRNIQWNLLPALAAVPATPTWPDMERKLERPWLDHIDSWMLQYTGPSDNQPDYGREFARLDSMASLMLMLDVPQQQKEKLMIELLQIGIDFHGLANSGREWFADGGHWNGRKWPIIFASLMLNDPSIREFPKLEQPTVYSKIHVLDNEDGTRPRTLFSEDMQTYYGAGGDGQTVLWQVVFHTHPRDPLEVKPRASFDKTEIWLDGYRQLCSGTYVGTALAARLMQATTIWDHDAFFDYVDRWMSPGEKSTAKIAIAGSGNSLPTPDLFVAQMWTAYRKTAKPAAPADDRLKWVWTDASSGRFVQNK
jgi:hypothetical protein